MRCNIHSDGCRPLRQITTALVLGFILSLVWSAHAALVDSWRASDLDAFDDGDSIGSWSSTGGRDLTASASLSPRLFKNVTVASGSVVRFDDDLLNRTDNSPVAGLTGFSMALVFKPDQTGSGGPQWYNNTGIVDAEQPGQTSDWGVVLNANGELGWGIGNPDLTLYSSSGPSLVDGNFHAVVCAWGDGVQEINADNVWTDSVAGSSGSPRNNAGLGFGGILTSEGGAAQRFAGDLVEVRFYDTRLTTVEMANVVQELRDLHITPGYPVTFSFTANPDQILIDSPVTLSWDTTNATTLDIQPGVGPLGSATGNVMVYPRTNTTYTLTTSNAQGVSTRQVTVLVDQGRPTAGNQSVTVLHNQAKGITLTGSDPQGSNLTYATVSQPTHGGLIGTLPNVAYAPDTGYSGTDQFTFRVNDGEFDSPPATVTLQVLGPPTAPSDITISTTHISSGTHPGSFIASFNALDVSAGDTHTFTLTSGFGDNSRFDIFGALLRAGDTFVGPVGSTFSIRVRATDSSTLWIEKDFNLTVTTNAGFVAINEVHYNPSDNTVLEEFIELHNPTAAAVDVSFWQVKGAVELVLPTNSIIPPDGFLVLAQDPGTLQTRYGITAVGPWTGGLSSDGEKITLEDSNGDKVDQVDYNSEFPWPVAADGDGASMELVHSSLDNDLGSSWRSSFAQLPLPALTYVSLQSAGWSWRPGDTEASNPPDDWRQQGFVQDGSWTSDVQLPIGYGTVNGVPLNTTISGMQNNYSCIFLRRTFTIAPGEVPSQLLIRSTSDDGFVMWINGREVERRRFTGEPAVGLFAENQGSEGSYETRTVLNIGTDLVAGINTIAVQLLNTTINSSDIGFDVEVTGPGSPGSLPTPSPGLQNVTHATNAAPNIRQVRHTPETPTSTNQIVITTKVTDPEGVASVQLQYQIVTPGNYIPALLPVSVNDLINNPDQVRTPNPDYSNPANWTTLPMVDDGVGADELALDSIYSVALPAQANRVLLRYRILIEDALGASRSAPFEDDPSLNFACYVYDGIPPYEGVSATALGTLPVYALVARGQDVSDCMAYDSTQIPQFGGDGLGHPARYVFNWPGTMVYDGVVYDNISFRLRGANGRYQDGKRNWRFKFNRGSLLSARDQFGRKFNRKWTHLTTGKGSSNHETLTYGLNEVINYALWNQAGVPAPYTFWFHFRVVDGADEAPDQYGGDFWGLNWAQEDYDGRFLDGHGLAKGNLYKLINAPRSFDLSQDMVGQQRYQAPFAVTNGTDGSSIQNNLLGYRSSDWIQAHVQCEAWYRYHTVCEAVRHYDFWPEANKNAGWYFEPPYDATNDGFGRFWTLPWDTDSSWGPTWNQGHDLVYNGIFLEGSHSDLRLDYQNVMREMRDLLFQPDQIESLVDAHAARIDSFVPADLARWRYAPWTGGTYDNLRNSPALTGLDDYVQDMMEFMFVGGYHDWWVYGESVPAGGWITRLNAVANDVNIPTQPTIYYVGQAAYPMNSLTFECLPFADPQGAGTFAALQWRLAEVRNTNQVPVNPSIIPPMEWNPIWESGTLTTWSNRITIPGLVVETNRVYRARVRHQDNTGRWSHWSAPLEFSVTAVDVVSVLRQNLRFSEIMYHPPAMGPFTEADLEFLELQNIGVVPLSVGGLTFTAGINFTFTNGTTLGAGQRFLLGRSAAALQAKYPGIAVNGIYSGKLNNGGETIRLSTPTGIPILEVTYKDSPPWPVTADGMGWSLVLDDSVAGTYRASSSVGGSPNDVDPTSTLPPVVITELLTHTDPPQIDTIELHNPTASPASVGGWFLTDKKDVPKKFRIPNGTTIGPGGYLTYDQNQYDTQGLDFNLSSLGDDVYLFSGDASTNLTGYVHGVPFGAAANGVSFGRLLNSVGMEDFVAMSRLTLGTNNSRPRVGPVVITEIMFHPPLAGTNENYEAEFIELQNVTDTNVPLYSASFPTNTWKLGNGVSHLFPTNLTLPVGGRLLVVSFDPVTNPTALATFRATYSVDTNTPVFGPWAGRLNNAGESIELKFPDRPELDGFVPYVMVEKVSYLPIAPWPSTAAGTGNSLQRASLLQYANDPVNWFAALPTAGTLSDQTSQDVDEDGMPDIWEMASGTDPYTHDANLDPDEDRSINYNEWVAGTNPQDPTSYLRLESSGAPGGGIDLQFIAVAGRSYSILKAGALDWTAWSVVTNISVASTNRVITLHPSDNGTQFYRLVTPQQP